MVTDKTMPNSLDEARDILTVEEAGHLLRLGRHAMYEAIRRGEIKTKRIGRRLLVTKRTLQQLLEIATDDEKEDACEEA